jgi:hypothetical protein
MLSCHGLSSSNGLPYEMEKGDNGILSNIVAASIHDSDKGNRNRPTQSSSPMPLTYRRPIDALKRNSSALSPCRAGRGRGRAPSRPSTEMFTEEEEQEDAATVSCAQWQ